MVKTLNGAISVVSQDTARIQRAYQQLCTENVARDKALADLTAMVRDYSSSPGTTRSHPTIQVDVLDGDGNLRAADIGITWEANETFMHVVRVVGSNFPRPVMSTPYPQRRDSVQDNTSTTAQPPTPVTPVTTPDTDTSFFSGDESGVWAGRSNPEIQQYIIELAGVVPTLPGSS